MPPVQLMTSLGLAVALLPVALGAQQQGGLPTHGPITFRTRDAAFIKERLGSEDSGAVRDSISKLPGGARVLSFVANPLSFASLDSTPPTKDELYRAREVAKGARFASVVGATAAAVGSGSRESAFLIGVTDFVLLRTKTELAAAALRQAKDWFSEAKDPAAADLKILFPSTAQLVQSVSDVHPELLPLLRVAGKRDLQGLPTGLWKVARGHCDTGCLGDAAKRAAIDALRSGAALAECFMRRESPIVALASLQSVATEEYLTRGGRIATAAAAVTAGEIALGGGDEFLRILRDTTYVRFAAVFFVHDVLIRGDVPVPSALLVARVQEIHGAVRSLQGVYEEFEELRESRSAPMAVRRERYAALARAFSDAAIQVGAAGAALSSSTVTPAYFQLVASSADIAAAVLEEDYVTAVALGLAAANQAGWQVSPKVVRWTSFAGGLASANTSEDVTAMLEQFALPPASYMAKRYPPQEEDRALALHLNAYLGASGGGEWLTGGDGAENEAAGYFGLALPVGLEVGFGSSRYSLFIPMLDLGAIASYRLGDSSTEAAPNVTFGNVVAPGAFLTRSISQRIPVAVGFGWQYAPRLRNLTTGATKDASRVGLFLASDVPLFRLR